MLHQGLIFNCLIKALKSFLENSFFDGKQVIV